MKRRDVLRSLAATGTGMALGGCTPKPAAIGTVTDGDVERMLRTMRGVELTPGQAAPVREMLLTMRYKGTVDPRVQPSLVFDPEVDIE